MLATGAKGPGFEAQLVYAVFFKHSVHPAINGYLTLFGAGECENQQGRGVAPYISYTVD